MERKLTVDIYYQKGNSPFISAVYGSTTLDELQRIESQCGEDEFRFTVDGTYHFHVEYNEPQFNQEGRMEMPGYYDMKLLHIIDDNGNALKGD